jgi:serine/threonine protein kinase
MDGSLRDFVTPDGPYQIRDADGLLNVFQQLLAGLARIHNSQVAHSDIKPGNLLFKSQGDPLAADELTIKYGDPGLVCTGKDMVGRFNDNIPACGYGGTPAYMSPEFFHETLNFNNLTLQDMQREDIWGLGMVFWALALGDETLPQIETIFSQADIAPATFSSGNPQLDAIVNQTINSILRYDPLERPSATEVLDFINSRLNEISTSYPPTTSVEGVSSLPVFSGTAPTSMAMTPSRGRSTRPVSNGRDSTSVAMTAFKVKDDDSTKAVFSFMSNPEEELSTMLFPVLGEMGLDPTSVAVSPIENEFFVTDRGTGLWAGDIMSGELKSLVDMSEFEDLDAEGERGVIHVIIDKDYPDVAKIYLIYCVKEIGQMEQCQMAIAELDLSDEDLPVVIRSSQDLQEIARFQSDMDRF